MRSRGLRSIRPISAAAAAGASPNLDPACPVSTCACVAARDAGDDPDEHVLRAPGRDGRLQPVDVVAVVHHHEADARARRPWRSPRPSSRCRAGRAAPGPRRPPARRRSRRRRRRRARAPPPPSRAARRCRGTPWRRTPRASAATGPPARRGTRAPGRAAPPPPPPAQASRTRAARSSARHPPMASIPSASQRAARRAAATSSPSTGADPMPGGRRRADPARVRPRTARRAGARSRSRPSLAASVWYSSSPTSASKRNGRV